MEDKQLGIPYFPGCTLSTKAAGYDRSGRAVAKALDLEFQELPEWQCCGATFPLATDNAMSLIAPVRLLTQAQEAGDQVTTLCAVCFHVLRRTQHFLKENPQVLERVNWFTEEPYLGKVYVSHFLELLRDQLTWEGLHSRVVQPLKDLKVAPYYGCLLLRPQEEINLDNPEAPRIMHDCLSALGCEVIDFPYQSECCGSYLSVREPGLTEKLAGEILKSARRHGAQVVVTACPLCQFNLDYPQRGRQNGNGSEALPVLYFTQLIAVAMGLDPAVWGMENHYVDPQPLFLSFQRSAISVQPESKNQRA